MMTCEERQDLIPLMALGALEPEEMRELRAHLAAGCPLCEGRLAEADSLLSMLPLALPPVAPPAEARSRVMQRVASGQENASPATYGRIGGRKLGPAIMGLAAGIIIAAGLFSIRLASEHRSLVALRSQLSARDVRLGEQNVIISNLKSDVFTMHEAVQTINSSQTQILKLVGAAPQPGAMGHVFVDRKDRMLLFCADKVKKSQPNKTYELWLVSGDKKIPIGTFQPDKNGEVAMITKVPPDIGPLAMAAVTDEPMGGMPQPTGVFQLLGRPLTSSEPN